MKRNYLLPLFLILVLLASCTLVSGCTKPTDFGTIVVKATLDGENWAGSVDYTFERQTRGTISGAVVPQSFSVATGTWFFTSASGGPAGAYLASITPSTMQTLKAGGVITFKLNFVTPEEEEEEEEEE